MYQVLQSEFCYNIIRSSHGRLNYIVVGSPSELFLGEDPTHTRMMGNLRSEIVRVLV